MEHDRQSAPGCGERDDTTRLRVFSEGTKTVETAAQAERRRYNGGEVDSSSRNLARFVDAHTVVVCVEDDPLDANFYKLRYNCDRLEKMTDQDGHPLRVLPLPMPQPVVFDGQRLPASYANFYVGNAAVIVPTFNDPNDRRALAILAELFPSRRVVGVHALDLVWGLGTLHCMTQQEPL